MCVTMFNCLYVWVCHLATNLNPVNHVIALNLFPLRQYDWLDFSWWLHHSNNVYNWIVSFHLPVSPLDGLGLVF